MKKAGLIAVLISAFAICANAGSHLRILYWNIQNGMWGDQADNYDNFVKYVKGYDPDICIWCEAKTIYGNWSKHKMEHKDEEYLPGNWDILSQRYGHPYSFVGMVRDNYPQAITSRYPLTAVARLKGERPDSVVVHGAGWVTVNVDGKLINIVAMHLYPQKFAYGTDKKDKEAIARSSAEFGGEATRLKEVKYVCEHTILTHPDAGNEMWIMAGDFNALARSDNALYKKPDDCPLFNTTDYVLANTPYMDMVKVKHPDKIILTGWSKRRIDYIWMTPPIGNCVKDIRVIEGWQERVRDEETHFCIPSDHLPILVDIEL